MFITSKVLQAFHEHNYHGTLKMHHYILFKNILKLILYGFHDTECER